MQIPKESLYYLQDESDAPYEEGECPYKFTKEDDERTRALFRAHGFTFVDEEESSEDKDESSLEDYKKNSDNEMSKNQ